MVDKCITCNKMLTKSAGDGGGVGVAWRVKIGLSGFTIGEIRRPDKR